MEGVCLGTLDMDFKTIMVHLAGRFTVIWVLGSNTKLTLNLLAHKKTKNPKQHTTHNISWSLVDRSKEH